MNTLGLTDFYIALPATTMDGLRREAIMRNTQAEVLAARLLATIVEDNLFGAVLDK